QRRAGCGVARASVLLIYDHVVNAETAVQIAFAVGVLVVGSAIAAALSGRVSRRVLVGIAGLVGLAAVGSWIVFALDVERGTAVAAGGLSVCLAAALLTIPLRSGLARSRRVNEDLNVAETALRDLVERKPAAAGAARGRRAAPPARARSSGAHRRRGNGSRAPDSVRLRRRRTASDRPAQPDRRPDREPAVRGGGRAVLDDRQGGARGRGQAAFP